MPNTFHAALTDLAVRLTATFALPMLFQPEDQLKAPVGGLLRQAGAELSRLVEVASEVRAGPYEYWEVRWLRTLVQALVSNVDRHSREDEIPIRLCNYTDVYRNDRITDRLAFMHATASADETDRFRLQLGDVIITKTPRHGTTLPSHPW